MAHYNYPGMRTVELFVNPAPNDPESSRRDRHGFANLINVISLQFQLLDRLTERQISVSSLLSRLQHAIAVFRDPLVSDALSALAIFSEIEGRLRSLEAHIAEQHPAALEEARRNALVIREVSDIAELRLLARLVDAGLRGEWRIQRVAEVEERIRWSMDETVGVSFSWHDEEFLAPRAFTDIAMELVDNAVRHSARRAGIEVISGDDSIRLSLQVHDNGRGIAETELERVAQYGVKAHRPDEPDPRSTPDSTATNTQREPNTGPDARDSGRGLGLSRVFYLARLYDGTVSLSSAPDEGTVADVSFKKVKSGA